VYSGSRTLGAIVAARAVETPDREIVRFEDGPVSCGVLDEQTNRVANALALLGLGRGDRVAVMLGNRADFLYAWLGIAKAGMVEVPLNVGLRGDMLAYMLNQSGTEAIVIDAAWLDRIERIAARVPGLKQVIAVTSADHTSDTVADANLAAARGSRFEELLAASASPPPVEVHPYDTSVILFTSGTTGPSKGAVLTHNANFRLATVAAIDVMEYSEDERLFSAFPLFHVNAKYTSVLPALFLDRGSLVLHDRFSASRFWDICRAENVTAFNFMGALLMMLHKQPERPDDRDHLVRKGYGAPAPAAITPPFEERFNVTLQEMYGSTELGNATGNQWGNRRIGTCGKRLPDYEVQIHDEHGRRLPPNVEGEIVVRPLAPHIMVEEYVGNPEATVDAFRGLWFHTGDRGREDADGWFTFVDRLKDAVRRRGENISSWEVEQVLNDHEAVEETAVIGVPSDLTEEEVMAVVKLKEGATLAPEALLDFGQDRLPHFAVPRYVRFVTELPKNHAQRIMKPELRAEGVTADTWDREQVGYVVKR
jgi:carnitine-CoA ligase